ncbi:unannotated protein [freshwater metagenome]|uniref:Unannotated protein n=1 Tax=freshwater metagenome TaxID=449393 RepID=A0A6J6X006_9ZZZZ|nr:DUF552 domain-containing protein [Actinomycetota bacterium]MSX81773.1 DUF552 domain-containing protein [Actinomycetota bacterium]MSY07157.1 DUF552 domain-containing protein [Actinomycetota bacterium]MSZ29916.1 DUF552 domain-containing protein [Actinomycetota bacterium]
MPGWIKNTMNYLGLNEAVDSDDDYDYLEGDGSYYLEEDQVPAEEPQTAPPSYERARPVAPAATVTRSAVRTISDSESPVVDVTKPIIRPVPASSARVQVVEPKGFNDAQEVGERIKSGQPVIVNLQGVDSDLKRRLIDFCSGLTYAIGGSMSRVSDQVFLLTPANVDVSDEEKDRLAARGLYQK